MTEHERGAAAQNGTDRQDDRRPGWLTLQGIHGDRKERGNCSAESKNFNSHYSRDLEVKAFNELLSSGQATDNNGQQ